MGYRTGPLSLALGAAMVFLVAGDAPADAEGVEITVATERALDGVGSVSHELVGFNMPPHTPQQTELYGIHPDDRNNVLRDLSRLEAGLVRQWINAEECGIDFADIDPYDAEDHGSWVHWIETELAPGAPAWEQFDNYIRQLSELGPDVRVMLCIPTVPVWLGPYQPVADDPRKVIDNETGEQVGYDQFLAWAGIRHRYIDDSRRFREFERRIRHFTRLLAAHIQSDPVLSDTIRYIQLGNETDGAGESNRVRWRMWVHHRDEDGNQPDEVTELKHEGLLQRFYQAAYQGLRQGDPDRELIIGGIATSWSHRQKRLDGNFFYLNYFVFGDPSRDLPGIGREHLQFFTYQQYGLDHDHQETIRQLHEQFQVPIYITEYNAALGGHGSNFMHGGAASVADVLIDFAETPGAAGTTFFKGSGGGFGLVLARAFNWHTGAFWTLDLFRQHIVDGQPLAWEATGPGSDEVAFLVVHKPDSDVPYRALLFNRSDEPSTLHVELDGAGPYATAMDVVDLPRATGRHHYRHVNRAEIPLIVDDTHSVHDPRLHAESDDASEQEADDAKAVLSVTLDPLSLVFIRWSKDANAFAEPDLR